MSKQTALVWNDKSPFPKNRALEILPGAVAWFFILLPFWGSFVFPHIIAYMVIGFDIYWFYKSSSGGISALIGYKKFKHSLKIDWQKKLETVENWERVHNIIIIPFAGEPLPTLERFLESVIDQTLPQENLSVVLAAEAVVENAQERVETLHQKFAGRIKNLHYTLHTLLPGEVQGKSSNESHAGKWAKKNIVDKQNMDIDYITVTTADCDSVFYNQFFACLSYKFLTNPNRYNRFWQGVVSFYNNIWNLPPPSKIMNTLSTVWHLGLLIRKDRLITYSAYSLSFRTLDELGYWDVDVIPEDYRMFFKAFFKLGGKVEVEPIFLPIYADAAESTTAWKTIINQYNQQQRWAWGVSDQSLILRAWKHYPAPFLTKTIRVVKVFADHVLWPTNWVWITLGANIPILLNPAFKETALGANLPRISSIILTMCSAFLVVYIIIDAKQRPPRPKHVSKFYWFLTPLEWLALPVVSLFLSALPAIDAHTRLMLGKYLEYKITEKV